MSGDLDLTLACWDYDRTRPLMDGRVRPEGIDLRYLAMEMPESFFRMLRFGEFHASEMSMGWYVRTVLAQPRPFIAIPVFVSRMFRHSCIYVNAASGICAPGDLRGKRIGCPEYQMTAAIWIKGILADRHDVPVNSVTYHTGGLEQPGRRETPLELPDDIVVEPIGDDRTLSDMLEAGEIDALYSAHQPPCFGRKGIRRLFEDYEAQELAYLEDTGIFPIMHVIVVRTDVLEAHPWVAQSLTKAFEAARDIAIDDLFEPAALKASLPWLLAAAERTRDAFGTTDFWPYGVERNRATLQTFLRYAHEQALTPRRLEPEELFVPSTLQTAKR